MAMTGRQILGFAQAHAGEEPDRDTLERILSTAHINLGLAEMLDYENAWRYYSGKPELEEPVFISDLDEEVPCDFHITQVLLPLWLCWKIFEVLDDDTRAQTYRVQYEERRNAIVPARFVEESDHAS